MVTTPLFIQSWEFTFVLARLGIDLRGLVATDNGAAILSSTTPLDLSRSLASGMA